MWLAPPYSTPPNKMRPLSREFSLFGEIEKWRLLRTEEFDVIIDTTDGAAMAAQRGAEFRATIEPASNCERV